MKIIHKIIIIVILIFLNACGKIYNTDSLLYEYKRLENIKDFDSVEKFYEKLNILHPNLEDYIYVSIRKSSELGNIDYLGAEPETQYLLKKTINNKGDVCYAVYEFNNYENIYNKFVGFIVRDNLYYIDDCVNDLYHLGTDYEKNLLVKTPYVKNQLSYTLEISKDKKLFQDDIDIKYSSMQTLKDKKILELMHIIEISIFEAKLLYYYDYLNFEYD